MDETRKKRLLYRANYRGFKEADILLGGFIKSHIDILSNDELDEFELLLNARDHDIYDWITDKKTPPKPYNLSILQRLKAFRPDF